MTQDVPPPTTSPAYFWTDKNDGSMTFWDGSNGDITLGTENSPSGGQTRHALGHVAIGTPWSYVIAISGGRIRLTINGGATSYPIPSSFNAYHRYFKAGDYNQSASGSTSNGAKVKFALARLLLQRLVQRYQPLLESEDRGLGTVGEVQLREDARHVRLHRFLGDGQLLGDLPVR